MGLLSCHAVWELDSASFAQYMWIQTEHFSSFLQMPYSDWQFCDNFSI